MMKAPINEPAGRCGCFAAILLAFAVAVGPVAAQNQSKSLSDTGDAARDPSSKQSDAPSNVPSLGL